MPSENKPAAPTPPATPAAPQPSSPASGAAGAPPAEPQPAYVTKDELTALHTALTERITGLVEGLAAGRAPEQPAAPVLPTFNMDELNEAIRDGKEDAAGRIAQLVDAKVAERLTAFHVAEVAPLRTYGLSSMEAIAKKQALGGVDADNVKRFEREIDEHMKRVQPEGRINPEAWHRAYSMVVGLHHEELVREAAERALRGDAERRSTEPPPGTGPITLEDGRRLPTLEDVAGGAEGMAALREKGIKSGDDLAHRLGYESWGDYMRVAAGLEQTDVEDEYRTPRQRGRRAYNAR